MVRSPHETGIAEHGAVNTLAHTSDQADLALYRAKQAGRNRSVTRQDNPLGGAASMLSAGHAQGDTQREFRTTAARAQAQTHRSAALSASLHDKEVEQTDASSTLTGPAPRTLWQGCVDLVMGSNPKTREHLRLPMFAFSLHVIWVAMVLWYAMPQQHIREFDGLVVVVYACVSVLLFYSLIRSGISARWSDPVLVLPQMLVACAIVCCGYVVALMLRPSLLHLLCVIQVFGMTNLTPRSSRIAVLMLVAALLAMQWRGQASLPTEVLNIALSRFILVSLAKLAHQYSVVRVGGAHA